MEEPLGLKDPGCILDTSNSGGGRGSSMRAKTGIALIGLCLCLALPFLKAQGKGSEHAAVAVPDSSVERPGDRGIRAHTNHLILVHPSPKQGRPTPPNTGTSPQGETPDSIRPVYNLSNTLTSSSGNGIIAVVDAFDYPTAQNDFDVFSKEFNLPLSTDNVCNGSQPCFVKVLARGVGRRKNCGWNQEAALDIEWAHAMAPHAQIVLVIAKTDRFTDLFNAVDLASSIVGGSTLGGEVSMSWGGSEFSSEAYYDFHFAAPKVVYVAASGDQGGVNLYPSVSPNVVSAGGTTINRDDSGAFVSETAWVGSGGGPSAYESRPPYQDAIMSLVGSQRGAPDFSFDADPSSGVSVYDSAPCQGHNGWMVFGGTSVSAQALAGIINLSNHFYGNSNLELSTIYANRASASDFRDITYGSSGQFDATTGWDFVTGVGSNQGTDGK
jgi:subtilase family serine protease